MKSVFTLFLLCVGCSMFGQSSRSITIAFLPIYKGEILILNQELQDFKTSISSLKLYVSKIEISNANGDIWQEENSYHLLDYEDVESMKLHLDLPQEFIFDRLNFSLGIDSLTNVSGAMENDLDPMHGMYWTWQSGYINVKIEGSAAKCPARKNKFQFHLGGYLGENSAIQDISMSLKNQDQVFIVFDIGDLIERIDVSKVYEIMSPRPEAVQMSHSFAELFKILE